MSWVISKDLTLIGAVICAACAAMSAQAGDLASSMEFDASYTSDFFWRERSVDLSDHGLGVSLNLQVASQWHWLSAAFVGVAGDPNHPKTTTVQLHGHDGLLLISELQRLTDGRVEKIAFGVWGYTQAAEVVNDHDWSVIAAPTFSWWAQCRRVGAGTAIDITSWC